MKHSYLTYNIICSSLIFAFMLASCGKEVMKYETSAKTPVVESYLKAGNSSLTVYVYSIETFDDKTTQYSKPIGGLNLSVNNMELTEKETGTYTLTTPLGLLDADNICELNFSYNNKTIKAQTDIPSKPTGLSISKSVITVSQYSYYYDSIPNVTISWDNPDNSYYQVYIQSLSSSSSSTQMPGGDFSKMMMQPTQSNSYTLKMHDMSIEGLYRCVLYKITDKYAELYEQMSSTDLANPVSYIENGLGVFTAFDSDTIRYQIIYSD